MKFVNKNFLHLSPIAGMYIEKGNSGGPLISSQGNDEKAYASISLGGKKAPTCQLYLPQIKAVKIKS